MQSRTDRPIGLILARGGSKGIPDKNLQKILGETLVFRCACQAKASLLDGVYVYSDDSRILDEAVLAGVSAVKRPERISRDDTTSEATVQAFLDRMKDLSDRDVCLLQCTTPFLKACHIDQAIEFFENPELDLDSVITVSPCQRYLGYPPRKDKRMWVPVYPYRWLRQSHETLYSVENGGLYLAKNHLWRLGRRIGQNCGTVSMGWWESVEIDDLEDLKVARRIAPIFDVSLAEAKQRCGQALGKRQRGMTECRETERSDPCRRA
jgi:N-acylneuraminate cytidylyltransferase